MSSLAQTSRFEKILETLHREGSVSVSGLARRFGVTEMTLRRDLRELEHVGRLKRVHGGAVPVSQDPGYRLRGEADRPAKRAIGAAAAQWVESGQVIYLDSGSTADAVACALATRMREESLELRVVTHALNAALLLAEAPGMALTFIGGEISSSLLASHGPEPLRQIDPLRFDLFLLGASGVDPQAGWTNGDPSTVALKREVHARAKTTWAVVDSAKCGRTAFHRILEFEDVHGWITDQEPPRELGRAARDCDLQLIVAGAR